MRRVAIATFALALASGACRPAHDAAPERDAALLFARATFEKLAAADPAAADAIDWESLRGASLDVGALYRALPDDRERAEFRTSFVASFAGRLREQGVEPGAVSGWRVDERGRDRETVAAEAPQGEVRITVAADARGLRVVAIGL